MDRALRLRQYGAHKAAEDLVSCEVELPQWFRTSDVPLAALDVGLWISALTGREWYGDLRSFEAARDKARRRRTAISNGSAQHDASNTKHGVGAFRSSHLLVDALDSRPSRVEVDDYSTLVGWPCRSDVGRLEWDLDDGLSCQFCDALLLRSEAQHVAGTVSAVCGKHCCAKG